MVGGATGDDHDSPDVGQERLVERALLVQVDAVTAGGAIGDRLGDRIGLFVDLLEHERLIAALLGGVLVPVDRLHGPLERLTRGRGDHDLVGPQDDDLVVVEELHAPRLPQERGHGRGDELLSLAAPDDQRALPARSDEHVGLVEAHRHECVVSLELAVCGPHGVRQIRVVVTCDQMRDHLGVGLRGEHAALREEPLLERDVVLDDPVDDDVHAIARIAVRMGVLLAHPPVRRPASVPDAGACRPRRDGDG